MLVVILKEASASLQTNTPPEGQLDSADPLPAHGSRWRPNQSHCLPNPPPDSATPVAEDRGRITDGSRLVISGSNTPTIAYGTQGATPKSEEISVKAGLNRKRVNYLRYAASLSIAPAPLQSVVRIVKGGLDKDEKHTLMCTARATIYTLPPLVHRSTELFSRTLVPIPYTGTGCRSRSRSRPVSALDTCKKNPPQRDG